MSDLIGQSIGQYHILEQLGEDIMATVYKAHDTRKQIDVAVKVIRSGMIAKDKTGKSVKRFEREARALMKLNHPNIVKISDYGEYEGSPYLVMPLLSGGTLEEKLGQPIAWNEAAALLLPIARALAYAHGHGIIHRDIKPSNILVNEGGEPLLDVTKLLEVEETAELYDTGIGTPEQGLGQRAGQRTDVYSLGVIFYEMVTGRKPYLAENPNQMIDPLPRPGEFVPTLPKEVENIILKALAKESADRYVDLGSFIKEVEFLLLDRLVSTYKETGKIKALFQSQWKIIAAIAGAALIILALGSMPWINWFNAAPAPAIIATATNQLPTLTFTPALPAETNIPVFTPTAKPLPEEISDSKGITMHLVPAGTFTMGEEYTTIHEVYLDAYYMDIYEVTNAAYKSCVDDGWCEPPEGAHYKDLTYADHPVIYVNWGNASTYCEWRSARLPTEAEWEKAARGTDGRTYPWGEDPGCTKANICKKGTTAVGSYESGKSPYGMYDMTGNVDEWVNDWYSETYYQKSPSSNPPGPDSGNTKVLRGGSWNWKGGRESGYQKYDPVQSAARWWMDPLGYGDNVGFRCALGVAP